MKCLKRKRQMLKNTHKYNGSKRRLVLVLFFQAYSNKPYCIQVAHGAAKRRRSSVEKKSKKKQIFNMT